MKRTVVALLAMVGAGTAALVAGAINFRAAPVYFAEFSTGPGALVRDFNGDSHDDIAVFGHDGVGAAVRIMFGTGDGTFVTGSSTFPVGDRPAQLASGDFNGDGIPDLAVANSGTSSDVTVALGTGDGTFNTAPAVPVGTFPTSAVVADFNGDGIDDLATANAASDDVSVVLGNGDGTFTGRVDYATGVQPRALTAVTLNGDASPDLAVVNRESGTVSVLLNQQDGSFAHAYDVPFERASFIAAADLNGDGQQDLAVTNEFGNIAVMLGNGDGTVDNPNVVGVGGAFIIADVNEDGVLDLATHVPTVTQLRILLGVGDGTFAVAHRYALHEGSALVAGDFNADGHLDVALRGTNTLAIVTGFGDGTFLAARSMFPGSIAPHTARLGDLNHDGITDLVVGAVDAVIVRLGTGGGAFADGVAYASAARGPLELADVNNDGHLDAILPGAVHLGTGTGALQPFNGYLSPRFPTGLAVADFNSDSNLDVVVTSSNGAALVPGNGDGSFGTPTVIANESYWATAADFNVDGKPDLALYQVTADARHVLVILLGNGDGTFKFGSAIPRQYVSAPAIADFNGDGIPDMALTYSGTPALSPHVAVVLGNGDGTIRLSYYLALPGAPGRTAAGDFDGDGRQDLVFQEDDGVLQVAAGLGNGTFAPASRYAVGGSDKSIAVGDYTGDGKPDLAILHFNPAIMLLDNISP